MRRESKLSTFCLPQKIYTKIKCEAVSISTSWRDEVMMWSSQAETFCHYCFLQSLIFLSFSLTTFRPVLARLLMKCNHSCLLHLCDRLERRNLIKIAILENHYGCESLSCFSRHTTGHNNAMVRRWPFPFLMVIKPEISILFGVVARYDDGFFCESNGNLVFKKFGMMVKLIHTFGGIACFQVVTKVEWSAK